MISDVNTYIEKHKEKMIADLAGFVEIPSVSADKPNVDKALDYILNLAEDMGFSARSVLNHRIGLIEYGEGKETLGILAHIDVVPAGEEEEWNTPPFTLTEKDGKLYGRGTIDDKGAIIASLYAMKYLKDLAEAENKTPYKKVQMILGTQEEIEWTDMDDYVKEYPLPDYGFTPDGEFPLCNIEKGLLDIKLSFPAENPVPFDADGWYIESVRGGTAENAVPAKCTAILGNYEHGKKIGEETVIGQGKTVHSCQPEQGENAIFQLVKILRERSRKNQLKDNCIWTLLQMIDDKFEDIYGNAVGLYSKSEYYNGEFVHRNVFCPTLLRTRDGQLLLHINGRFAYGTDAQEIIDTIDAQMKPYYGKITFSEAQPAVYVAGDRPFIKAFGEAYEEGCGRKHRLVLAYGGSYAKAMPGIVSWGPIFPEEEDTCHCENEYISIDSLLANARIFALALEKIVLSENEFK